jgi:hypothetical protein
MTGAFGCFRAGFGTWSYPGQRQDLEFYFE